jgi:hypothetical protein
MGAAEKRVAAVIEPPPSMADVRQCGRCSAAYLDYDIGRDAHEVVFGHQPVGAS